MRLTKPIDPQTLIRPVVPARPGSSARFSRKLAIQGRAPEQQSNKIASVWGLFGNSPPNRIAFCWGCRVHRRSPTAPAAHPRPTAAHARGCHVRPGAPPQLTPSAGAVRVWVPHPRLRGPRGGANGPRRPARGSGPTLPRPGGGAGAGAAPPTPPRDAGRGDQARLGSSALGRKPSNPHRGSSDHRGLLWMRVRITVVSSHRGSSVDGDFALDGSWPPQLSCAWLFRTRGHARVLRSFIGPRT